MYESNNLVSIEQLNTELVDQVADIENYSFKTPWPKQIFLAEIERGNSFCRIAIIEDFVAGYCISNLIYDELHIFKIAVHQEHRRKGIGKYLLEDAFDFFKGRGAKNGILEVRVSNESAIKLYKKIGFKPLRIRKNYYQGTKEDALVMSIDLESWYQKLLSTT